MDLFSWELKKIFRRKSTKIGICLILAYAVFLSCYNVFYAMAADSPEGIGKIGSGIEEIAREEAWADQWKGALTEEKLLLAMEQYRTAHLPENLTTFEDGSTGVSNEAYDKYIKPLGLMTMVVYRTFSFLPEYDSYYDIPKIPDSLTGDYYNQRELILAEYLKSQLPDEKDRAYFLAQEAQVKKPFYYDFAEGQYYYVSMMGSIGAIMAILLCVILAPVFAGEYQSRCDSLLLSSRRGRKQLATAKVAAGMVLTAGSYIICAAIYITGQLIFLGTRGLSCPIQLIKPLSTAPVTIWQAEIYGLCLGLLSCMAIAAIAMAMSSCVKAQFLAVAMSLIVLMTPMIMKTFALPLWASKLMGLFPFADDQAELFRTNLYHLFGLRLWSPWVMLGAAVVFVIVALPLAKRSYIRHEA